MTKKPPGRALADKPLADQLAEIKRLRDYLRDASAAYRDQGHPGWAQVAGKAGRLLDGLRVAIHNEIARETSCCEHRIRFGSCDCAAGLP